MLSWLRRQISWKRDHNQAWFGAEELGEDGRSPFQRLCMAALEHACDKRGHPVPQTVCVGTEEPYLTGLLADGRTFFIYCDGAEVGSRSLEKWDYRTPAELCDAFAEGIGDPSCGAAAV